VLFIFFIYAKFCHETLDSAGWSNSILLQSHRAADWFLLYQQPMSSLLNFQILGLLLM